MLPLATPQTDSWAPLALVGTILGYLLTLVLIRWVLLTRKRHPASAVAWIMAIIAVPVLGGLLFLVFGINRVERRKARHVQARRAIEPSLPEVSQFYIVAGELLNPTQQRLMRLAHRLAGTVPTSGNRIELLPDTNRTLGLLEKAIRAARESVHLEYYIWQPDKTGTRVRDLLVEKAREGVAVRFLYDVIGSIGLTRRFLKPMRAAGIHIAPFLPGRSLRERFSLNLRNHRKIAIVDGQVGFTGGMNIGDEYLGKNPHFGFWRDTHLRLTGPTVLQLQQVFAEDWYYATGEELIQPELFPAPDDTGHVAAQVVAGGPSGDAEVFHTLLFTAINEAREHLTLATSYFVPPDSLVSALEAAAYRGVRVRLLLAGRSAHVWTLFAARSYYDSLLEAGVEIYEYDQGLLHSKTLTIDGQWSLVGTPNFDSRSLFLNFEVAVVLYDSKIAAQLESHYDRDLARSRRIAPAQWKIRPEWRRLSENICRLFAPVM